MELKTLLIVVGITALLSASAGYWVADIKGDKQIVSMALNTSNKRVENLEQILTLTKEKSEVEKSLVVAQTSLVAKYNEGIKDGQEKSSRVISDLRNDVTRLRVSIKATNTSGGDLSSTTGGSKGGDEKVAATLTPTVAARLAGRYASYNEIVEQLSLCQGILNNNVIPKAVDK